MMTKIPFKCPVCEGRGMVPTGFYGTSTALSGVTLEQCMSCAKGIVWGHGTDPQEYVTVNGWPGISGVDSVVLQETHIS